MSYHFQVITNPVKFNNKDFFNSKNFWNYQKKIGIRSYYIEIKEEQRAIGYIIVTNRKFFSMDLYGSPIRGIGADFQGFAFYESNTSNIDLDSLLSDFTNFIEKSNYVPLRMLERKFHESFSKNQKWHVNKSKRYLLNLERPLEEIRKGFSYKSAIYEINKAEKRGVYVEREYNIDSFLDLHFKHLENVFSRKNLPIPHSKSRLKILLNSLNENQFLLCIAYNSEGLPIASNTYLVSEEISYFYTAASLTKYLKDSPNEILMYESIKHLQSMGSKFLEFGRGLDYKRKYGPEVVDFLELFSKKGYWKIDIVNELERRYKRLRKSVFFKRYLNKPIARVMHFGS